MRSDGARQAVLTALTMGLAFSWLPPCLLLLAMGPLPQAVFIGWSSVCGIGGLLVLGTLLARWN